MAETRLVVEHREQLWSLLVEAAQIEHMIMCQYLYACFSLKTDPDERLTAEQADAPARWPEGMERVDAAEFVPAVPEGVSSAATTAAAISEQLARHVPQDLRPA